MSADSLRQTRRRASLVCTGGCELMLAPRMMHALPDGPLDAAPFPGHLWAVRQPVHSVTLCRIAVHFETRFLTFGLEL